MSYDTVKKLSINLKKMEVKYAYSPSNVRDWNDNLVVYEDFRTFETKKELEDWLMGLVSGHYGGCSRISRSVTLFKRIMWLEENNLIEKGMAKDTEEVRKVLTGEKKVKPKMYILENNRGYKLKVLKWRVRLQSFGKASKLYKSELESIQEEHADFLNLHGVYATEVA